LTRLFEGGRYNAREIKAELKRSNSTASHILSLNIEFFSNPGTQNFKLNNFKLDMCLIFYQTFYIKLDMQILDNSVYCLFQNCSVISNAKMSKQGGFPSLQSFFYSESDNFYKLIEYRSILSSIVTFP